MIQLNWRSDPVVPITNPQGVGADVIFQIYRDSIRGATKQARHDGLARLCDRTVALGVKHHLYHGFPTEFVDAWDPCATLAQERNLTAMAAWGLDSSASAKEKGRLIASVLARPSCRAGAMDAEGQWDSSRGPDDETSERGAVEMTHEIRSRVPDKPIADQCWFDVNKHGSLRRQPKPMDQGGIFAGFPVDEFALLVNWARFRQPYCNNAETKALHGEAGAYPNVFERMFTSWNAVEPALAKAGLARPLGITIQGYKWHAPSLVHCLLTWLHFKMQPVIVWGEPFPDAVWIACYQAVQFLLANGFAQGAADANAVVLAYQRAWNAKAPEDKRLEEDGACGEVTMGTMGVVIGG